MDRQPVTSRVLRSVGYDPDTETLEIEFVDGDVYQYVRVPPRVHENLLRADSKGAYFNDSIKEDYTYRKLR